jgi:hypothetical protein
MAEPGSRVQVDKGRASGCLRIAIRHADDAGFLQPEHIVDVDRPIVQKGEFGRSRIAEDPVDAECTKHTERRFPNRKDF